MRNFNLTENKHLIGKIRKEYTTMMLNRFLLLLSVLHGGEAVWCQDVIRTRLGSDCGSNRDLKFSVATTAAVECFYKGDPIPGIPYVILHSMECEDGCCGTTDHQECCDDGGLNWWMVFAFILVGLFTIFAIVAAVYLILKKKNKKKERVGNTESNPAQDQPSTIDLSVFSTSNLRTSDPPAYTMHHDRALNHYSSQGEDYLPQEYQENARNEAPWRNSDFSYFDKYLERTKQSDTGNRMETYALNRSPGNTENALPTKLPAEYEELRVSMDPDLTAECRYIGHTSENSAEPPTLERTDTSHFHFMAPSYPS